jgi:hypothetical protein
MSKRYYWIAVCDLGKLILGATPVLLKIVSILLLSTVVIYSSFLVFIYIASILGPELAMLSTLVIAITLGVTINWVSKRAAQIKYEDKESEFLPTIEGTVGLERFKLLDEFRRENDLLYTISEKEKAFLEAIEGLPEAEREDRWEGFKQEHYTYYYASSGSGCDPSC